VFGAGGGTSSYEEIETTDVIVLWGSNAREAHPIFFHHILKGIHNGARMFAVDPRLTSSGQWADTWLGIDVGSDIALANAVGREIIEHGWTNSMFVEHSTSGFDEYEATVEPWTLSRASDVTGVPSHVIAELAEAYATADSAQLCWTLGITEHHNATDNVLALINLALLTGHVGRYGSGLVPIRGQNNVQGGGDMGALPNKLPGFQDVADDELRGKFEVNWGIEVPSMPGLHISLMFDAIDAGDLNALYIIGENPARSEADLGRAKRLLGNLDFLVVQDMYMTATAEYADVVLPAAANWVEGEGTVTSSERRVQRARKALDPPGEAKEDIEILSMIAERMGHSWGRPTAEELWDELRSLSPMHAGMSYRRLEELGGIQWPCLDEDDPGTLFLHAWLWEDPLPRDPAPFIATEWAPAVDVLTDEFPIRMTTGRRLDSYNTGEQTNRYPSPIRIGGVIEICEEDALRLGVASGDMATITSRRGSIDAAVLIRDGLRPGLAFMALHHPDEADVNQLTIDAWDPKSGTAEFKATAIRIEPKGSTSTST